MNESCANILRNRSAVYRLLAVLWGGELTDSSLHVLQGEDVRDSWLALGGADPSELEGQLDRLAEDYCRLLIGPTGHLPPVQSVWTGGELQTEVVSSLTEFAAVCGYRSTWNDLLPDHLANELQLMALTLDKSALETETASAAAAHSVAASLFENHLVWAHPFLDRVRERDHDGFYDSLATVTQSFLRSESSVYAEAANRFRTGALCPEESTWQ